MSATRVLLRLVRFSPGWFAATLLFGVILFVAVPIPLGLATRAFFDALSGSATLSPWSAIAVYAGVQAGELFVGPLLGNPWNAMQQRAQVLLQRNLFAAVLRGHARHGVAVPVAEAISLFRDDPRSTADALDALADLVGRSIFAAAAAAIMWTIHPLMTAVLFAPILATSVLAHLLGNRISAYHAASREATSRVTGFLGELVGAQLAVKVAGAAPHAVARLRSLGDERRRVSVRNTVFDAALNAIHFHLVHVATGAVLLIGARDIRTGSFTVGDFAMFVLFLDQLMYLPTEIGRLIGDLRRIDVSMRRMRALVPSEPPSSLVAREAVYLRRGEAAPAPAPPPARERLERLELRGITRGSALRGVSFALERGSFTVVTGRVGSGKTTLLATLLGLVPRDAGEILWNGRPVDDPAAFFVPPRSAYTPQVPRLFSETVRENVLLGHPSGDLDGAVRAAVLEADVATLERGLDTTVGPRGVRLSGGQIQRTAAARMFVRDAELLVLDDLSSALDAETEAALWTRLFARGDATCLVVSHRPAALRRADTILLLDGGRLVAEGTLDELLDGTELMRRLWHEEPAAAG